MNIIFYVLSALHITSVIVASNYVEVALLMTANQVSTSVFCPEGTTFHDIKQRLQDNWGLPAEHNKILITIVPKDRDEDPWMMEPFNYSLCKPSEFGVFQHEKIYLICVPHLVPIPD